MNISIDAFIDQTEKAKRESESRAFFEAWYSKINLMDIFTEVYRKQELRDMGFIPIDWEKVKK